jgi:UDPglucose 6-dehydrogenase
LLAPGTVVILGQFVLVTGGQQPVHISVIGTGYVGLVTGACFSEFGVNVTCMDTDATRVARLEKGDVPFYEPGISELVAKGIRENRISFTTDVAKAVDKALVIFIAVGTPPRSDGSALVRRRSRPRHR